MTGKRLTFHMRSGKTFSSTPDTEAELEDLLSNLRGAWHTGNGGSCLFVGEPEFLVNLGAVEMVQIEDI